MILLAPKQVNTYFNLTTEREQDGNVFDHTNEDSSMGIPLEEPEIHMPVEVIIRNGKAKLRFKNEGSGIYQNWLGLLEGGGSVECKARYLRQANEAGKMRKRRKRRKTKSKKKSKAKRKSKGKAKRKSKGKSKRKSKGKSKRKSKGKSKRR